MSEPNEPGQKYDGKNDEREVTDPITHLPLIIHDADSTELERIPPPPTAAQEKKIREERGADSQEESNSRHVDMESAVHEAVNANWWEDPIGDQRKTRIQAATVATGAGAAGAFTVIVLWSIFSRLLGVSDGQHLGWLGFLLAPFVCCLLGLGVGASVLSLGSFKSSSPSVNGSQKDWIHPEERSKTLNKDENAPESAEWLNSILNSLWPIVNPALFISVADMLEDSVQATLPKLVHGVRVADVGQGSESVRILGVRWLDAGSAGKDVNGMKAEEGAFINMELAIAYRAKETTSQGIRGRSANAHVLMEFWVAAGMMVPVWVDLTGFLAVMRVRFQLTPNPPFLSVMTITLLGLPKISFKCTPLAKKFLNIMDVPGLSGWLQRSINLALQEYVAPRSLTLDLTTMLMGRPKMDTDAVGVIVVTIKRAEGCKAGDAGKLLKTSDGQKGDLYVTVGWSKWGKPLWSTRIISSPTPMWEETTILLVGPSEMNAQEGLILQIWDSDRFTADDLLGNVNMDLKDLMTNRESKNRMSVRADGLVGENGESWPGTLHWECGYYAKTTFEQHLENKHQDAREIRVKIEREAENKLREAKARDDNAEDGKVEQQKKEDMKEKSDEIVAASKPTAEWPSGILSIRIEQISGLEVEKVRESGVKEDAEDDDNDDLPSAYCTIMINQQKVYKTRTKMKSNNPFYDAGTEKFIRDWRTSDVIISVRDSRVHEVDPVIGIVVLPLRELFRHNSQFTDSLPLIGGIGYGRMRLALTFRSVQMQLPKNLLGWDVGTLEIHPTITHSADLPPEYIGYSLKLRTLYGKSKMIPNHDGGGWSHKPGKPIRLAVKKRYASCLLIQFRKRAVGSDLTPAFCTLWLKDIPDDEEVKLSLPVRKNVGGNLDHARKNTSTDIGDQVGTIELTVRLWPGLSGYHKLLADHDKNMADVMEVLDYAEGSQKASQQLLEDENYGRSSSSSSSSEEGGDDQSSEGAQSKRKGSLATKDGVTGQFKDFRKQKGDLHRKHRGLMQWKAARNVAWIGRGVEHQASVLSDKVKGTFKHQSKDVGIEKEV